MLKEKDTVQIIAEDVGAFKNCFAIVDKIDQDKKQALLLVRKFEFSFTGQNMYFWFPFADLKVVARPKEKYFSFQDRE